MASTQRRTLQVWLPLLFGITMAAGMFFGYQIKPPRSGGSGIFSNSSRSGSLEEVMQLLRYKYVDSVAIDSLESDAIAALLQRLDPHTVYIPPKDIQEANAELEGKFGGIGIEYQIVEDTLTVIRVVAGGPSEKAGLQQGDQVIAVDGKSIVDTAITVDKLRERIRGKLGSTVVLTLLRDSKQKNANITRGIISMPSVEAAVMLDDSTGFIRLSRFSENTYIEFMDAFTSLEKKGMKRMVLDLRGNGGGLMEEATKIADELLEDGVLIVSTKGRSVPSREVRATKPGVFETQPLVVLVDETSASASEVLAGALQDNDRGTVIGRRSFGKGLVQEQFDLKNGGALRMTVARYFTPTGRSIQRSYANGKTAYMHDGLIGHSDSAMVDSSRLKSFKTRKGRMVYEGGGIQPDMVVTTRMMPKDSVLIKALENDLLSTYSYRIYTNQRSAIQSFKTLEDFAKTYTLPEDALQQLAKQAAAAGKPLPPMTEENRVYLNSQLIALIGRYKWQDNGYYYLLKSKDPVLLKAMDQLNHTK